MRTEFGGHFLVMAAEEALPPVRSAPVIDTIDLEREAAEQQNSLPEPGHDGTVTTEARPESQQADQLIEQ